VTSQVATLEREYMEAAAAAAVTVPLLSFSLSLSHTQHTRCALVAHQGCWEAVVLPAWDGSTTALAASKPGFGRRKFGDLGPTRVN
jgi:hypothetical protein